MNEAIQEELDQIEPSSIHNMTMPIYEANKQEHKLIQGSSSQKQLPHQHSASLGRGGKMPNMYQMVSRSQAFDIHRLSSQRDNRLEDYGIQQREFEDFGLSPSINSSQNHILIGSSFMHGSRFSLNQQRNQASSVQLNPNFFYSSPGQDEVNAFGRSSQGGKTHIQKYYPSLSERFDFDRNNQNENLQVEDFSPPDQEEQKRNQSQTLHSSSQRNISSSINNQRIIHEVQEFPSLLSQNKVSEERQTKKQQHLQGLMILDEDSTSNQQNYNFSEFDEFVENSKAVEFQVKVQNFINEIAAKDSVQNLNNANNQDKKLQNAPLVNNLFSQPNQNVSYPQPQRTLAEILDSQENKRLETDEYEDDFEELDEDDNRRWNNEVNSNMQGFSQEKENNQGHEYGFNRRDQDDIEANKHDRSNASPSNFLRKPFNQQAQESFGVLNSHNQRDISNKPSRSLNNLLLSQQTVFAADQHNIVSNLIQSPKDISLRDRECQNHQDLKEVSEIDFFNHDHIANQLRASLNSMETFDYWNRNQELRMDGNQKQQNDYNLQIEDEEEIKLDQQDVIRLISQEQRTSQNSVMSNYLSDSESRVLRSSHPTDTNILNLNLHSRGREQSSVKITKQKSEDFYNQFDVDDQEEESKFINQQSANSINLPLQYAQSEKILNKYDDQSEPLIQRGRNSVLEEVEDDDIVNQNSSKSTSKAQSQERQNQIDNRLEIANQILQSFSQASNENLDWNLNGLQLVNQRQIMIENEEVKEEIKEESKSQSKRLRKKAQFEIQGETLEASQSMISNNSAKSSYSSRRRRQTKTTNHGTLKFTYFASSSLSDDRWLCPICLDIFEDAVETPCCHNLFCDECIKKTPTCPLCNLRINGQLKPNIPIRRLVNELSINCINQFCEDVIRKGEIEKHLKICPYTPIVCPNNEVCGKYIRKDIEKHKNEDCSFRIVECLLKCGLMLPLNDMEDHIAHDCPKFQVKCKNNCQGTIERGEMDKHISIDCPLQNVDCPNKIDSLFEESCQIRLKRKEMETHKLTCNYRRVYCQNQKCGSIIIYKDLLSHDERCLFKIIDCDNNCGIKVQRQYLEKHKESCENQLVKCSYYDHGCKVEILRKYYLQHLQEEAFNHSIIFIEGQKKRNREMEELKYDFLSLRQNYDVEIQAMFLELHRLKDEMAIVKQKSGINTQNQGVSVSAASSSNAPGAKLILGNNAGLGAISIQRNRLEALNSSAGSNNYEQNRGGSRPFWLENSRQNNGQSNAVDRQQMQNIYQERERFNGFSFFNNGMLHNQPLNYRWGNPYDSNNGANSNTASLAQSAQSLDHVSLGINLQNQNIQRNAPKPPIHRQGWIEDSGSNNQRNQRQESYNLRQNFQNSGQNFPNLISNNQNDIFSFITNRNNSQANQNTSINDQVNRRLPFTFHSSNNNNINQVQNSNNMNQPNSNNRANQNNHASNYSRFTFNSNQIDQNHHENEAHNQIARYAQIQGDQSNGGMNDHALSRNILNSDQEAENRKNQLAALFMGSMNGSVDCISDLSMERRHSQLNNEQMQNVQQQLFQSYQNLYNHHRQSVGENGQENQRMSFGFAQNSSSPQIHHASSSPLPSGNNNNNLLNSARMIANSSPTTNFNQSNNLQGSQQSGMNLGGVVAHLKNNENSFGVLDNQLNGLGVGRSINLEGGRSQNQSNIHDLSDTSLMLRSMGNIAGISGLSKNQEGTSSNQVRSNNMRNVSVNSQLQNKSNSSNIGQPNSDLRRFQYNPPNGSGSQVLIQSSRRISQEGIGGMNDISESQENSSILIRDHNKPKVSKYDIQIQQNLQSMVQTNQDLDSSNVIYDDDFEIEEEKNDY